MKIAFRLYKKGKLALFEQREIPDDKWEDVADQLGEEHAEKLFEEPHMIEIEFLDEPDINQRFFRFGTDPNGMIEPMQIALEPKEPEA